MPILKLKMQQLLLLCLPLLLSCGGANNNETTASSSVISVASTNITTSNPVENNISVVNYTPSNLTENVAVNTKIEISFSEDIDSSEVVLEFSLSDEQRVINGQSEIIANKYTFISTELLDYNTNYNISIQSSSSSTKVINALNTTFTTQKKTEQALVSFFPQIKERGTTPITINAIESVAPDELVKVSFGIPFPKGYLTDINNFRIVDESGDEVSLAVKKILPWRDASADSTTESIRSVVVQLELTFSSNEFGLLLPRNLALEWGHSRSLSDIDLVSPRSTWVLVDDDNYSKDLQIFEPRAYAIFSPQWYGDSVIKTRLLPFNSHPDFSAFDTAFKLFGDSAINYVDPRVLDEQLQPLTTSYAAWLFDRAMTLYQLAFRSGEFKYLRAAHKATQFYLQHINDAGYFSLKPSNDMKYSYGESLVANYILQGDDRIPDVINKMIPAWDSFNVEYTLNSNFWTERQAAFKLFGYITAYEILGTKELFDKTKNVFSILRKMQISPAEGVPTTGALMHTAESHSEGGSQFIASPWMSAMLISAVERYSIHFDDNDVGDFVLKMANFFQQDGVSLYEWKGYSGKDSYYIPHYLAGSDLTDREHGGIGAPDLEHTVDVNKIFSIAYFFSCAQGECDTSYLSTIARLDNSTLTFTFPYWIRSSAPDIGKAAYRLAPPRKFSWWFKNSANNDFLLGVNTKLPQYKKAAPLLELIQTHDANDNYKPNDEITFHYQLKNTSSETVKNVVVYSSVLEKSPNDLLAITAIDKQGINRSGAVVWKFEQIAPNEVISDLSFTVKVNDFVALQKNNRPIGDILAYATLYFCSESDTEDTCITWENNWDMGKQTFKTQSNWQNIKPTAPDSPPSINIISPLNYDLLTDIELFSVEVEDPDGVAKVELLLNDEVLDTSVEPPFQVEIQSNALSLQEHQLSVKAWDSYGSQANETIAVTPQNPDIEPPIVTIVEPIQGRNYCQEVNVKYEVNDNYTINGCEVHLNDSQVLLPSCGDYKVFERIPLFKAVAHLPFDLEVDEVVSQDGKNLIGAGSNINYVDGVYNKAVYFNGSDAIIDFSVTNLSISNDITVSFWLNPSTDEGVILSQGWDYIGVENGWAISLGANNHLNNNARSITWSSGNAINNANNSNVVQTPSNSIALNQWQHVVVRKQNNELNIFIDGELITSGTVTYPQIAWPFNASKQLSIAKAMVHPDMYNKNLQGSLDDLAIWNTALANEEIVQLYQSEQGSSELELTIYAKDKAGNIGNSSVRFNLGDNCN